MVHKSCGHRMKAEGFWIILWQRSIDGYRRRGKGRSQFTGNRKKGCVMRMEVGM